VRVDEEFLERRTGARLPSTAPPLAGIGRQPCLCLAPRREARLRRRRRREGVMYPVATGPPPARLPAASRVDKATSHLLQGPDWAVNLEICDTLNADRW